MEQKGKEENNFGVAALIFGVLSILFSLTIIPSFVLGVLGVVFGIIQLKKGKDNWAMWGFILSIIGIIISIFLLVIIVKLIVLAATTVAQVEACTNDPTQEGCEKILKAFLPEGLDPQSLAGGTLPQGYEQYSDQYQQFINQNGGLSAA